MELAATPPCAAAGSPGSTAAVCAARSTLNGGGHRGWPSSHASRFRSPARRHWRRRGPRPSLRMMAMPTTVTSRTCGVDEDGYTVEGPQSQAEWFPVLPRRQGNRGTSKGRSTAWAGQKKSMGAGMGRQTTGQERMMMQYQRRGLRAQGQGRGTVGRTATSSRITSTFDTIGTLGKCGNGGAKRQYQFQNNGNIRGCANTMRSMRQHNGMATEVLMTTASRALARGTRSLGDRMASVWEWAHTRTCHGISTRVLATVTTATHPPLRTNPYVHAHARARARI